MKNAEMERDSNPLLVIDCRKLDDADPGTKLCPATQPTNTLCLTRFLVGSGMCICPHQLRVALPVVLVE